MNDTLKRITVYHDEEMGMLAQRAETLTINKANINATRTQEISGHAIDCQGPSHGGSYMDEGISCIRNGLLLVVVSEDCLASPSHSMFPSFFACACPMPDDTVLQLRSRPVWTDYSLVMTTVQRCVAHY